MSIEVDLTAHLASLIASAPVEQNKLAEEYAASPAVVFFRRQSSQDLFLDGAPALNDANFDLEIYGTEIDAVEAMADTLKSALNGFRGAMGATFVLGAFVSDHESDYIAKSDLATDEGLHSATFALQIIY